MARFKTKTEYIEAIYYDGINGYEVYKWSNKKIKKSRELNHIRDKVLFYNHPTYGQFTFYPEGYIVKTQDGLFWDYDKEEFLKKYESAEFDDDFFKR